MMKGICLRYSNNETEAEDLLQESFIKAFNKLDTFNNNGALGGWLRKIAVNTALEHYRKNKNKTVVLDLNQVDSLIPDNAIESLELEDLLKKIQSLPTGFRTVFNLYAVEGYNHREIGEMLSISEGTSKSQYSRARVLLRDMIAQDELQTKKVNYA